MKLSKKLIMLGCCIALLTPSAGLAAASQDVQKSGLTTGSLPVNYEQIKNKQDFSLAWTNGCYSDFREWQKAARQTVNEHLLAKYSAAAFQTKTISKLNRGTYTAQKLAFNISDSERVSALMLTPKGRGPFPAVVLYHDHGAKFGIGKEKMIKPWNDKVKEDLALKWSAKFFSDKFVGDELAKRGYIVLAVDALGWGDRGELKYTDQQALASNMLHMGSSLAGKMAVDDVRSVQLLKTLPKVDKQRIAALGFSMGAYRAWQAAALSDDIKATVAVCWMAPVKALITPGNNTLRGQSSFFMVHPGLMSYLDYPDYASIAAPKPTLFFNGGMDKLFPKAEVNKAYAKMHKVWDSQNAGANLTTKTWDNLSHVFVEEEQKEAFDWLDKQMKK